MSDKLHIVSPISSTIPCACCTHDAKAKYRTDTKTMICAGCNYTRFCNKKCSTAYWKQHKKLCKLLCKDNTKSDFLVEFYQRTGLYTGDGETWRCVPSDFVPDTVKFLKLYHITKLLKGDDDPVMQKSIATYEKLQTSYPDLVRDHPIDKSEFQAILTQPYIGFHNIIYGLVQPVAIRQIYNRMKKLSLNTIIDPMAYNGAFIELCRCFGNDSSIRLIASDLTPCVNSFMPVREADALDESMYDGIELHNSLCVLSWPDYTDREPVSPRLIKLFHRLGVRHILFMTDNVGSSISKAGFDTLNNLYREDDAFNIDTFFIGDTSKFTTHLRNMCSEDGDHMTDEELKTRMRAESGSDTMYDMFRHVFQITKWFTIKQ